MIKGWGVRCFLVLMALGCDGGEVQRDPSTTTGGPRGPVTRREARATEQPAANAQGGTVANAGSPSSQGTALGDSIFHGLAGGGTCAICHGQNAKGTALGPDLTDATWLHGDGSLDFIIATVTNGVPTPKQATGPMPPMGGGQLTPDQVRAVATYVYSLSRGGA